MGARPSAFALTSPGPLRLYSTAELLTLPPPEWLVEGVLPEGGLVGLYGPPESYKSFLAIDLALSVATGLPWCGHAVKRGLVLYVAAEGGPGISKRVRAWLTAKDIKPSRAAVAWLVESITVATGSEDLDRLMQRLDGELPSAPVLIIIDTLARCFDGDENQQEDMGRFVAGLDKLRHEYGATLVAIHHTRLDGERERGNTAFRGGVDTMVAIARDKESKSVEVSCDKQKDAEHFESFSLTLSPVAGTDSCILVNDEGDREEKLLEVLKSLGKPVKATEWQEAVTSVTGISRKTFYRGRATLAQKGLITKENGLYTVFEVSPK